ncbi:unnamed protein product [Closterium sp. NIES-54]
MDVPSPAERAVRPGPSCPGLHPDRGGEFSSYLLRDFCCGEGITQSFTLSDSPQQNGIAELCVGLVMEVARTSMIHVAAPHFLWPFAVRYAAHQLNLWPHVSLPETSPTLRWTGKVGDASVFRFYHPTSRRVLPSHDVTFDESVPFYRLFPYRSAPPPPPPLFLASGPPPVDPLPPQGPAPSGVSQVDPLPGTAPVQVAVVSGAAPGTVSGGAASRGAEPGGAGSEGAGSGGAELEGVEPGGAESEGAESGGAEPWGAASSGAPRAGEPGDTEVEGAAVSTGAGDPTEPGATGAGGAGAGVAGVGGPGAGGAGAAGAGAVDPGAGGAGGTVRPRPYFIPLLLQVLGVPSSTGLPPPFLCPPPDQSQPQLQPASPLPVPSPYTEQSGGLTEHREPASRPVSPVRIARRAPRSRPPPVLRYTWVRSHYPHPPHAEPTTHGAAGASGSHSDQVLQHFGFQFSSPQLTPLSTSHSLSAPPSDESVEPSGPYPELTGCLIYLMTCTRPDLAYPLSLLGCYVAPGRHRKVHWDAVKRVLRYLCSTSGMGLVLGGRGPVVLTGHADVSWVDDSATQRSSQGYTFSLGSGSVSWQSTRLSLVLSSSCEAEIYARAMAAQELRWLTYLLADLGEQPCSPPVLYVDNKAMIALCEEHRQEHRTKHIALPYFLARELQQRGQLRLAHVATRANTADVFTKALLPGDHQRFLAVLGLVLTFPHLLTA